MGRGQWLARMAVAGGVMAVLMLALLAVYLLVSGRGDYRQQAIDRVASGVVGQQRLAGPVRVVPYTETRESEQEGRLVQQRVQGFEYQLPTRLQADGALAPQRRRSGLYPVVVYRWQGQVQAGFDAWTPPVVSGRAYGRPYLVVGISDVRGLAGSPRLQIDGRAVALKPGSEALSPVTAGLHAPLAAIDGVLPPQSVALGLDLAGTHALSVLPLGEENRIDLTSTWPHPRFDGQFLTADMPTVDDNGFKASWRVSALAAQTRQQFASQIRGGRLVGVEQVSVSLLEPMDVHVQALRATKYGFLFVLLTLTVFGVYDLVRQLRLHPLQYLLVGMALVIFFLLLLSLGEQLPFAWAYLVASVACIALQAWYLAGVLGRWRPALGFATALSLLYAALYGLLVSQNLALLLGSLLLFVILAGVMGLTRRLSWRDTPEAA